MFKGMFYTFPKFLWNKGTVGKILLGVYIAFWLVAIWVQHIGADIVGQYIVNNRVYGIIILAIIITSTVLSILFTKKSGRFINRYTLISIFGGIVVIAGVILFGMLISKDLIVIPEHKILIKNIYAVSTSDLNIRIGPSANDEVMGTIKANTKIQVFPDEKTGDWIKIKHNDIEGYANTTYIKIE